MQDLGRQPLCALSCGADPCRISTFEEHPTKLQGEKPSVTSSKSAAGVRMEWKG